MDCPRRLRSAFERQTTGVVRWARALRSATRGLLSGGPGCVQKPRRAQVVTDRQPTAPDPDPKKCASSCVANGNSPSREQVLIRSTGRRRAQYTRSAVAGEEQRSHALKPRAGSTSLDHVECGRCSRSSGPRPGVAPAVRSQPATGAPWRTHHSAVADPPDTLNPPRGTGGQPPRPGRQPREVTDAEQGPAPGLPADLA
jgi:hypothetical protein